jgi:hypothetical protein
VTVLTNSDSTSRWLFHKLAGPVALAVLVFVVFGSVFAAGPAQIISEPERDGHRYFSVSRAFGFGEIGSGNMPLWNPHVLAGVPYHAGIQSALLYPVNLIYVVFPLPAAMNVDVVFHLWLLSVGAFAWARMHGATRSAAVAAGAMAMFAGSYYLHVRSGHLTLLAAFAWAPFFFASIDRVLARPSAGTALLGIVPVAMMLLAGYPQAAYSCALVAAVYIAVQFRALMTRPIPKIAAFTLIALVPASMAAAQLGPTAEFAQESVRAGGVEMTDSFEYSMFPHLFIKLIAPGFFGGAGDARYWGGGYPLETGVFIGRAGLLLAVFGLLSVPMRLRFGIIAVLALSAALAVGPSSFVAPLFHDWVPGFNRFRAPARYWMFAEWFASIAAALGASRFAKPPQLTFKWTGTVAAAVAWIAFATAKIVTTNAESDSAWTRFVDYARQQNHEDTFDLETALEAAAQTAPASLLITALVLTVAAAILWIPIQRGKPLAMAVLVCMEMTAFAYGHRRTFDAALTEPMDVPAFQASRNGQTRVLNIANNNEAMRAGAFDVSGYEPGQLALFNAFMLHPNGGLYIRDADGSLQGNALADMLRSATVLSPEGTELPSTSDPLPRFLMVPGYEVLPDPEAVLDRIYEPTFDPRRVAILSSEPGIAGSDNSVPAIITITDQSTDHAVLEVAASSGGILLCTDVYSTGWRVRALSDSDQQRYTVLPANYLLRAIPLKPGTHRLEMYYEPRTLRGGMAISIVSTAVVAAFSAALLVRRRKRR